MRRKITMVTLGVADPEKAAAFYEKGLGWTRSADSQGDIIFFPQGGFILAVYPRHLLAEDTMTEDKPAGFSGITLSHNCHSEQEVNEVLANAQKAGAEIIKPAQKVFWGGYSGYFKDPDGHLFEVAYNPFWEMDGDGNVIMPSAASS